MEVFRTTSVKYVNENIYTYFNAESLKFFIHSLKILFIYYYTN